MAYDKKYLKVKELPNQQGAEHPFNNEKNHQYLLDYCLDRVRFAHEHINGLRDRFEVIDRELSGFLKLDKEDKARQVGNIRGDDPKPVKAKPAFAVTQLGRVVTYLASVFAPDTGIYQAVTTKNEQAFANAVVHTMNMHGIKGKYFRQLCKFFLNALKYNLAAQRVEWITQTGVTLEDQNGRTTRKEQILYSGNLISNCNMYNTFWDPTVFPVDIHNKGEFVGEVCIKTPFQIKRMVENGDLFNTTGLLESGGNISAYGRFEFYRDIPQVRINDYGSDLRADGSVNWYSVLTAGRVRGYEVGGVELVDLYIRLIPREFGLITRQEARSRTKIEVWRITIANSQKIVATEYMNNTHDYLPYAFTVPQEDDLGLQHKSIAEDLVPFQNLGSFMFNTFVDGTRKNIWDLIVYDPQVVDLASVGNDVAARVPALPTGYGKDLTKSIWHMAKNVETDKALAQIQNLLELMEYVLPTRMLQQVADVDRAVKDQVAVIVQSAQRESWKLAKIIDDQAMSVARFVSYSNLQQFQESISVLMPTGEIVEVNPSALRKLNLEFKIGEGLKTIDKLQIQIFSREILNAVLSSGAVSQMDIVGFINYISSLNGMEADLNQFKLSPQQMAAIAAAQNTQPLQAQGATNGTGAAAPAAPGT